MCGHIWLGGAGLEYKYTEGEIGKSEQVIVPDGYCSTSQIHMFFSLGCGLLLPVSTIMEGLIILCRAAALTDTIYSLEAGF